MEKILIVILEVCDFKSCEVHNQKVKLEVNMKDETVWLNVNQMAKLFGRDSKTIRKHINML